MSYGASSMQGWRVNQEDAHNHILSFDGGKSLFAVYDGHGGHEVAEYCSKYLPDYIKKNENYKTGNYEKALEDCFINFDATLVDRKVVAELKVIAGSVEEDKEDEEEEVDHLCKEASMPIEQVIAKYNGEMNGDDSSETSGEPCKPLSNPLLAGLRGADKNKPISPFLRAKSTSVGEGSSGLNKHIRFNESGEELKDEVETKEENGAGVKNGDVKENGSSTEHSATAKSETKTELVNGKTEASSEESKEVNGKTEAASEESKEEVNTDEKENKDTNGVVSASINQTVTENIVTDIKGKGKGKGKGKSSQIKSSSMIIDVTEQEVLEHMAKKKEKRTAMEIYSSLQKASPESDDEVSEDSEDEEFGADSDSDSDEDGEGEELEEDLEDEEEEEDSEMEEEDEEGVIEADFTEEPGNDSGCTAVLALLAGSKLYVANAGDSRCVVCRDGKAYEMSFDHKPEDEIELNRIQTAGGKVTPDGRVNGGLNLSRAIGDHAYKQNKTLPLKDQMISSQPDIKVLDLDLTKDSWMILACDGIWNFMTSEEVVEYVNEKIKDCPADKLSKICEELFDTCLAPTTEGDGTGCDNMTAVIIKFNSSLADVKDIIATPATSSSSSSADSSSKGPTTASSTLDTTKNLKAAEAADSSSQEETSQDEAAEPKAKRVKLDTASVGDA